jgi:hypothetical protein
MRGAPGRRNRLPATLSPRFPAYPTATFPAYPTATFPAYPTANFPIYPTASFPELKSSTACCSSSRVFITNGPCFSTGSRIGWPSQ